MTVPAISADWNLTDIGEQLTDPALPYEQFEAACDRLGQMYAAIRWADVEVKLAMGDAILAGEFLYGEQAYQAFERFEVSEEVRKECVRIARQVPKSIRKAGRGLSWSHLRAVAPLPPKEQREWLKRATEEGLSHHALREELAASRNGAEPIVREVCGTCGRPL